MEAGDVGLPPAAAVRARQDAERLGRMVADQSGPVRGRGVRRAHAAPGWGAARTVGPWDCGREGVGKGRRSDV